MEHGCVIWLLIPSRTDTKYFQRLMDDGMLLYFIKGRLKFNDGNMGAPFPSVLIEMNRARTYIHTYMNGTIEDFMERKLI